MYDNGFGRIINISSVHGLRASEYKVAYVTAKHALEGLSKVTALEGGPHGVTSNCVNPGYVRTPLVTKQIADQARTHGIPEQEVVEDVLLKESAIKRLLEPEEVASLVGWLASPDAGMVTGASYTHGRWLERSLDLGFHSQVPMRRSASSMSPVGPANDSRTNEPPRCVSKSIPGAIATPVSASSLEQNDSESPVRCDTSA